MTLKPLFVPVISIITGVIALVLSIIVVVGNAKSDTLQMYATVELNTSTILQNLIKTETVSSNVRRDLSIALPTIFPSLPQLDVHDIQADYPFSRVSSFFNSIKTSIIPQPTGTGSITSGLDGLASNALSQIVKIFGDSLNEALNSLISEIIDHVGIRDWYGLYFGVLCSADYSPSFSDPDASLSNITCKSLRALKSSDEPKIPDTFQVGTTILDISALNIPAKLTGGSGQLTTVLRILYILGVVGIVLIGILILVSPILFLSRFRRPIVHFGIGAIAALATILILFTALIQTIIGALLGGMINQLANDFGIYAKPGIALMIIAWLSVILLLIPTSILLTLWFNGIFIRRSNVALEKKQIPITRTSDTTSIDDTHSQIVPRRTRQISHSPLTGNSETSSHFSYEGAR
ncbi:putative integral membrane protein [Erysiphe neolycopersici]|uniref:Putative integral membrane protein n=1 Tax=Erysiphe neolycopersici TaxID=212602 RepID=A0A420HX79_9PEZI|nr:putative integral membrane protein [Erysiphe neolycopersici]